MAEASSTKRDAPGPEIRLCEVVTPDWIEEEGNKMEAEVINRRLVKFIWASAIFFAWTCIQGIIMEQAPVREFIHLVPTGGMISGAHSHIGCSGWTALALMAASYLLPY